MAGTIVADTLQDGSSNSTAMTNAIKGSAKAWVTFDSSQVIQAYYNVSSITTIGTGIYQINFTNALPTTTYAVVAMTGGGYTMYDYTGFPRNTGNYTVSTYYSGTRYTSLGNLIFIC